MPELSRAAELRGDLLPSPDRLTQIDRARAADQPDTGADQSTDNDTWRAANQTNSRANARAGQAAVARRCTATAE